MRVLLLLLLTSAGACVRYESLVVDGVEREFRLHRPLHVGAGAPAPLLLALHGGGGSGRNMQAYARMDHVADAQGFIVAYPSGLDESWNDGRAAAAIGAQAAGVDDVAFLRALIVHLSARYTVDPARVYATGISNGAMMSLRLACELSDVLAAVAPVAGSLPRPLAESCRSARPISVLFIHGTDDALVPYGGGMVEVLGSARGEVLGVEASRDLFAARAGCAGDPTVERLDQDPDDGTVVERRRWGPCPEGQWIEVDRLEGGGHSWPGAEDYPLLLGTTSHEYDASERIWAFFAAQRR